MEAVPALVDVIIPVFGGCEETRACLESVLASGGAVRGEVIVVDDCTPDMNIAAMVRDLRDRGRVRLIENKENLGFVRSANLAAGLHQDRDFVLLNSDTLVAGNWLDRLAACACRDEKTGTVTPFSNNATLASFPRWFEANPLPEAVTAEDLDRMAAEVNAGQSVEIPTAVGFCMYVRRECWREAGPFDAETFGQGYGEENDFCMRARASGWRHMLAADVFVYHAGGMSFGKEKAERQQAATEAMRRRHPHYDALVDAHWRENPARPYRLALGMRMLGERPGGSEVHTGGGAPEDGLWLRLAGPGKVAVEWNGNFVEFDSAQQYGALLELLRAGGVRRLNIHDFMALPLDLDRLCHDLGAAHRYAARDYAAVCPQITMTDSAGWYCGEPDETGCNRCLVERPRAPWIDIVSWRTKHAWVVEHAEEVSPVSAEASRRLRKYFPERPLRDIRRPEKLSVVAVGSIDPGGQLQATAYLRLILPLAHPAMRDSVRVSFVSPWGAARVVADILLVQRASAPDVPLAAELIRHARSAGMRIVYDTDDDLFDIPEGHPDKEAYSLLAEPARRIAAAADAVLASTEALRDRLARLNPRTIVLPNALDDGLWFGADLPSERAATNGPLRILAMGTPTHTADLRLLEPPMRRLKAEFGDAVELEVVGMTRELKEPDWYTPADVPGIVQQSYPLFARWLRQHNRWEIGVSPLVETPFNRAKSFIKYLEYSALGLAGVYARIPAMESAVEDGVTGLLAGSSPDEWYEAIRRLVRDRNLRESIRRQAGQHVQERHLLSVQASARLALLAGIKNGNLPERIMF